MRIRLTPDHLPAGPADAWVFLTDRPDHIPGGVPLYGNRLLAMISYWHRAAGFEPKAGQVTWWPTWETLPARAVALAGTDRLPVQPAAMRRIGSVILRTALRAGFKDIVVRLPGTPTTSALGALALGLLETSAWSGRSRRGAAPPAVRLEWAGPDDPGTSAIFAQARAVARARSDVRPLANAAGNEAPPRQVAAEAGRLAAEAGLDCAAHADAWLRRERMGALLAVARGSHERPRFVVLRHRGRGKAPPVVLVGKTITFDSGGISIKPGKGMEWMKFDKSGGMAVLAAMLAAARLRLPVPVVGLLAVAENMPGGGATRPGDVIATRSGRTVEIVNTDAEGRLVLADALDYAAGLKPRAIVDLATLTGAAVTALGHVASPVMANHEPLLRALGEAGTRAGERLWPLPLFDDYAPMLRSPFADCRNIGDGTAGTIAGGMFLREFVPDAIPWAHIDITHAWEENERGHTPVGATLFGAALLVEWLRSLNP